MDKLLFSAVVAVVSGLFGAATMWYLERRKKCFDAEYLEGAADAARGRYIRRDATPAYKRGHGHASKRHKHHWGTICQRK